MKTKLIVTAAVLVPLSGCGLPPAISIASMLMDVGSFAATGKSATDHVISAMAGEDCAVMKILEGNLCEEEQQFEDALATLQPLGEGEGATQIAQTEPINYKEVFIDPVESGEPTGTQVGHVSPFVKIPIDSQSNDRSVDDSLIANSDPVDLRAHQIAQNTRLLSSDPRIEQDAFLSDAHLPLGHEPAGELASTVAPESVKSKAEPQEPQQPEYTELRPEQVKVADLPVKPVPAGSAVEPVKVQLAALPSTDDVGVAPQVAAGASTTPITAQSVAEDSVHESNSLLDVAQQRALSGALAYAPQEREDDRAWHSAGSFGSNLRHGR